MRRSLLCLAFGMLLLLTTAGPAGACAGLVTPSGNISVLRTATLAAYTGGVEHYVTSFEFAGGGAEFGSLVPLPGEPSKIERGGDWTLQRLQQEFAGSPGGGTAAVAAGGDAEAVEVQRVRIDALDVTVLRGGGAAVGEWAADHGFRLSPDAPEVLDFYAARSPYFLAAVFDASAAEERGQQQGEGTPVHLTIPTDNPWVPLRILGLGRPADERVSADVFLLTDREPAILPAPGSGLSGVFAGPARPELLDDLRGDKGMGWVPAQAHVTYLQVNESASLINYDLAVDASGAGRPSAVDAGLADPPPPAPPTTTTVAPTTSTSPPSTLLQASPVVVARSEREGDRSLVTAGIAVALLPIMGHLLGRARRRA